MNNNFDRVEPTLSDSFDIPKTVNGQDVQPSSKKSKPKIIRFFGWVILIFVVLLFSGIAKIIGKSTGKEFAKQDPIAEAIEKSVETVNKKTPISVGNGITLVEAEKGDKKIVYIMKIDDSLKIAKNFGKLQKEELIKNYCEKMKPFVNNGISAEWTYTHLNEKYVITISPSNCIN